jgi:hypothetical protein
MKKLRYFALGIIFLGLLMTVEAQPAGGQSAPAEKSAQSEKGAKEASDIPLKSYQEILANERKLLQEDSEKYYNRADNLINQAKWFFGIAGTALSVLLSGLLGWTFLKTQRDVKESLRAKLEEAGITQMQKELKFVIDENQKLKQEIDNITAYQRRHIKWLYATGCTVPDRSRLEAAGLQNITPVPVQKGAPFDLADADLVILSHEGDEHGLGKDLFTRALKTFIQERLKTPLVVYTLKNYRLADDEFGQLGQLELAVPANTQVTLVGYVESLLRIGKVRKAL